MLSNAFLKSTKQLKIFLPFRIAAYDNVCEFGPWSLA